MRTLPEASSVDYLRRQAKDLLAELRRSDPTTTLSDAQAGLARQYGYGSWPELKAAAEKQSAKPPVEADRSVVAELAERFGLGPVTAPMVRVERVWAGQLWEVEAPAGRVVLTELEDYVSTESIEIQAGLIERALQVGVLAPSPVRTTAGDITADVGGARWRVQRWLRLGPTPVLPPPPAVAAAAGRTLAELHGLALPPPAPVSSWLTQRPAKECWCELVDQCHRDRPEWAEPLRRAVDGYLELETVIDDRDPNPRAILSHAFVAPSAVHVAGQDAVVLCSWEHACATPPDWELGGSLLAWAETGDGALTPGPAQAFLDAYRASGRDVPALDLGIFSTGITGGMNWTASRVNIALNDSDAEHREIAARMVPGLLANPMSLDKLRGLQASLH